MKKILKKLLKKTVVSKLLVGLGNPGPNYVSTRHNIGFDVIDAIASDLSFPPFTPKYNGLLSKQKIDGKTVLLFKPQNFMNCSGTAIAQLVQFFKIPLEDIIVFHDELDLPVGEYRIKQGGGSAGHNGLKSIDQHVGNNYHRVRIGIDHPGDKDRVSDYVLSKFKKDERKVVDDTVITILQNVPELLC